MIHYIRYVCIWLIVLFMPAIALAQCPVQETVILYINGIDTLQSDAEKSKDRIRDEVIKESGVIEDCLAFDHIYNTNEPLFLDFLEAGIQKAREQGWDTSEFWRWFFRLNPFTPGFGDLLADFYSDANILSNLGLFVLGDQVNEHLKKYREYMKPDKRLILVAHSQGALYANEEWNLLTDAEKSKVNIIAVATPTNGVAGNGPNTTLYEDWIAGHLFPRAMAANIGNDEPCGSDWNCHGFKESYMKGKNSLERIVDQIVSLLPTPPPSCRIEGIIRYFEDNTIVSGASVILWNYWSGDPVFQTVSDSNGHYCIKDVSDDNYAIDVNHNGQHFGGAEAHLPGTTEPLIIDIMLYAPM